jgi:cobyrinic acid a,c-diamide synthase
LRGHEFHYSRVCEKTGPVSTVFELKRGTGIGQKRDGIVVGNTLATYLHVHALGEPEWASAMVRVARGECSYGDLTTQRSKMTHQYHSTCGW